MIKNIIFDLGNVLISFRPEKYLEDLGFEEAEMKRIIRAIVMSKYWAELDRGTISERETIVKFCEETPEAEHSIRRFMKSWKDMLVPIPDTIAILKELKKKGYNLYVLSNYQKEPFQKTLSENDFFSLLDGRIISYEVNYIKPEKEIYELLLDRYKLIPEESLFIDDMQANIEGAERSKINGFLFRSSQELKEYLQQQKIL